MADAVKIAISAEDMIAAKIPVMTSPFIPLGNVMRISCIRELLPFGRSGIKTFAASPSYVAHSAMGSIQRAAISPPFLAVRASFAAIHLV